MAFSDHRFLSQQKQRICCILSSLTLNSKDLKVSLKYRIYHLVNLKWYLFNNNNFYVKSNQLGLVYAFIIRWQQEDGSFIRPDESVFETVISKLISEQTTPIEEREQAFTQLIRSGAFDNNPDLLKIAEKAKLYCTFKM